MLSRRSISDGIELPKNQVFEVDETSDADLVFDVRDPAYDTCTKATEVTVSDIVNQVGELFEGHAEVAASSASDSYNPHDLQYLPIRFGDIRVWLAGSADKRPPKIFIHLKLQ
jgi:hypothetical protein